MMLNIHKINESLEKKYYLMEKYSDSMPDWLGRRLDYTQHMHRGNYDNDSKYPALKQDEAEVDSLTGHRDLRGYGSKADINATRAKFPEYSDTLNPSYSYRGNPTRRQDAQNSLYYNFRSLGIPLDKVEVQEGPMPVKGSDSRLKEPNIPIFLFDNGQVYAKGVNDNEIYWDDEKERAFKFLPMKYLLANAVSFAYIDGSNPANFNAHDTRAKRRSAKGTDWRRYERDKSNQVSDEGKITTGFDKSGYPVPLDKWEKANKTYISQYQEKILEKYREKLIEVIDEYKVFHSTLFDSIKDRNTKVSTADRYSYDGADIGNVYSFTQKNIEQMLIKARNYYDRALSAIINDDKNSFNSAIEGLTTCVERVSEAIYDTGIMPEKLATIDWI